MGHLLEIFVSSFAISFGAVVSPGPVTAAVISESPRQGWRVGPLVSGGHALLEFVMVMLIGLGLSSGMASPRVQDVIAIAGGAVLLFIGGSYLMAVRRGRMRLPKADQGLPARSAASLFSLGMLTTISNPFWYTWWVTVAAGYLSQAQAIGTGAVAAFYLGHISADFAWNTFLATATGAGRRLLTQRMYALLIVLTGGFMIFLGLVFIRSALGA
ncbi:MAG: LysE family transporter [Anaerolineales bacterium]